MPEQEQERMDKLDKENRELRDKIEGTYLFGMVSSNKRNRELLDQIDLLRKGLFDPIRDDKLDKIRSCAFSDAFDCQEIALLVDEIYHLRLKVKQLEDRAYHLDAMNKDMKLVGANGFLLEWKNCRIKELEAQVEGYKKFYDLLKDRIGDSEVSPNAIVNRVTGEL